MARDRISGPPKGSLLIRLPNQSLSRGCSHFTAMNPIDFLDRAGYSLRPGFRAQPASNGRRSQAAGGPVCPRRPACEIVRVRPWLADLQDVHVPLEQEARKEQTSTVRMNPRFHLLQAITRQSNLGQKQHQSKTTNRCNARSSLPDFLA